MVEPAVMDTAPPVPTPLLLVPEEVIDPVEILELAASVTVPAAVPLLPEVLILDTEIVPAELLPARD